MSLTQDDLQQIRSIAEGVVSPLYEKIEALENDIKEIYQMISELQSASVVGKSFKKLSLEEKLLQVSAELIATAKQAGITTLPRPKVLHSQLKKPHIVCLV